MLQGRDRAVVSDFGHDPLKASMGYLAVGIELACDSTTTRSAFLNGMRVGLHWAGP
jgi:hypothetical protein